jgi:outer membrane protein
MTLKILAVRISAALIMILMSSAWPLRAGDPVSSPGDDPITLEELIEIALDNSSDIMMSFHRSQQAKSMLDESKAAFFPMVRTYLSGHWGNYPHVIVAQLIDTHEFENTENLNLPGTNEISELTGEVSYNLYDGGGNILRKRMAETASEMCNYEYKAARNSVVAEVIHGYFNLLAAEELVGTAHASVETIHAAVDETRARYADGAALRADLIMVEYRLQEAEEAAIHAETGRKLALASLAVTAGLDAFSTFEIVGLEEETRRLPDGLDAKLPDNLETAMETAVTNRPEIARAELMAQRLDLGYKAARTSRRPRVDFYGKAGWQERGSVDFGFEQQFLNWYANLTVSWQVFDGGIRKARIGRAMAQRDEQLVSTEKQRRAVQLEVANAYIQLERARAGREVAEKGVASAEESLSVSNKRYREGAEVVSDYLEVVQQLTVARMKRTNSRYELHRAQAEAARTLGIFGEEEILEDAR